MKARLPIVTHVDVYYDETGDRIRQMFVDAETKRKNRLRSLKLIGFWFMVFSLGWILLFVKIFTMHGVVGLK